MTSSFLRFLDHTRRRITVGRTPLGEWSARRRDYLTTHNTHNRQTSMPLVGFEPTISAGQRLQTYALDREATGTGNCVTLAITNKLVVIINSPKVPKIKKILLYEIKFIVPNYSCLQNPWLGGYRPQIPFLSVLNWICWTPPRKKILVTPLHTKLQHRTEYYEQWSLWRTKCFIYSSRMFAVVFQQDNETSQISNREWATYSSASRPLTGLFYTDICNVLSLLLSYPRGCIWDSRSQLSRLDKPAL